MYSIFQVLLLKHCSPAFSLLHTVQRSLCSASLVLPNDTVLSLTSLNSPELVAAVSRIFDEILAPLRRISIEKAELSTLKALILLHPDVTGISAGSREKLRESRDGLLRALFTYLSQILAPGDTSVRLSSLLLIIPALYSIAQLLSQNPQLGALFGLSDQAPPAANTGSETGSPDLKNVKEEVNNFYKDSFLLAKSPSLLAGLVASQALSTYGNLQTAPSLANPAALPVSKTLQ